MTTLFLRFRSNDSPDFIIKKTNLKGPEAKNVPKHCGCFQQCVRNEFIESERGGGHRGLRKQKEREEGHQLPRPFRNHEGLQPQRKGSADFRERDRDLPIHAAGGGRGVLLRGG